MRAWITNWICTLILGFAASKVQAIEPDPCIPPDTIFAMKIWPRQILTSALGKDLGWDKLVKTILAAEKPAQEFLETAGLCLERDLESILLCMPSSPLLAEPEKPAKAIDPETGEINQKEPPAEGQSGKPWLLVIEGKFNPEKIGKGLEVYGESTGAPIRKLKGERTTLLQIESDDGPIFLGFDGNSKIIASNQLERLKRELVGGYDKTVSPLFRASMKGLTGNESLWMVYSNEGDLKKQLQIELNENPQMIWKELNHCQMGLTVSDSIRGKLIYSNRTAVSANAIKAELSIDIQIWRKQVEGFLKDPHTFIPKKILANKDFFWLNMMFLWELTIPYAAARLSKMEVQGNDTVFLIEANRKSLEPLLQTFGLLE